MSVYYPQQFEKEGFIHNSTNLQVDKIANRIFKNHQQVILLYINENAESKFIKYENLSGGAELYPHIYRHLPKSSICKKIDLNKNENGIFEMPIDIVQ